MENEKYNPEMPSTGFDVSDYHALHSSNVIASLKGVSGMHFDNTDGASLFFARELDYVKAKAYDKKYPELTAINHFPITNDVPEGAETVTYYAYENTGMAKIIANYAEDLPRADVKGHPSTALIKSIGGSYGYSVQEMRASRLVGKSLDIRKATAARYAIDRAINTLAFAGDEKSNIMGMLSKGNNVPLYTIPEVSGKTTWREKSAADILADINGMFAYQSKLTQDVEKADTLALPPDVFIDISTRQIPNTGLTVKKFILENAPYLKTIISAPELSGENKETNPYCKNVALLFTNDAEKFSLELPLRFYQYPLQTRNLEIVVPCEARAAGIILYYPLSALIATNI